MFILKFFASIILLGLFLLMLFVLIGFLLASNLLSKLNESLNGKFEQKEQGKNNNNQPNFKDEEIPSAIECPVCGTFYAEMPKNKLCSCGARL